MNCTSRATLSTIAWLCGALPATTGCTQRYHAPTQDQPHAIIEFRRNYAFHAGSFLHEQLVVDRTQTFEASDNSITVKMVRSDSVLIRPGQHQLEASASFTHMVKQVVQELDDCGGYDAPRTCRGPKSVEDVVVDAECHRQLSLDVQEGQLYLLQLDLQDAKTCSLSCFVQTLAGSGDVKNMPCPVAVTQH